MQRGIHYCSKTKKNSAWMTYKKCFQGNLLESMRTNCMYIYIFSIISRHRKCKRIQLKNQWHFFNILSNFKHFARTAASCLRQAWLSLTGELVGGFCACCMYACTYVRLRTSVPECQCALAVYRPSAERTTKSTQLLARYRAWARITYALLISQISGRDVAARPVGRALLIVRRYEPELFHHRIRHRCPEAYSR